MLPALIGILLAIFLFLFAYGPMTINSRWEYSIVRTLAPSPHLSFFFSAGVAAFSNAFFGQGTGTILLDNLFCVGSETRLADCPHNGVGIENCVHAEDASLRCAGNSTCAY